MIHLFAVGAVLLFIFYKQKKQSDESETATTTLTNPRGSDGMGLPSTLSQKTIDTIVATAPVVAPKALDITSHFYAKVIKSHPEILAFFNPAHNVPISLHQPKALAASIVAYASNITDLSPLLVPGGPVASICNRHCALCIFPAQYVLVHDNLMASIGEVLGSIVSADIAAAWSEAVLFLAKAFIDTEESLYQMAEKRSGGWSGLTDFEVIDIKIAAEGIKSVSFKPPQGSILENKKFEFSTGQYLTIKVDPEKNGLTAPRHYTVTSPPFADYLQCTVKKQRGGKVSTYIHEDLKVGDIVKLAAPYGVFTLEPSKVKSAVLISAGIGVTPMINFQRALGDKVKLSVHVDSTPEAFAYRTIFQKGPVLEKFTRTPGGKRPTAKELVTEILDKSGTDNNFYICGPEGWMTDIQAELLKNGAKMVMCEVFGSQLATGCPFFQSGA
mmetsp:Transcript_51868/g.60627  ORF Transcript_51868/g.60627 Transcript_51868/m.60627 type:complete len:442 (+) Transcript_51868:102-1427(+)|eukprot:CAMPEP_0194384146 /NCGR_PEP_ID=MMETSP0174-20130528/72236_1 /TAXON_ID=216777 /ORGANISM="Proboscia alata, Strain PI-D3" /LENGTH=441 /DNA_ID=CAMNT_0039171067 /DNA_START=63 /DNA_END=1388 /DNA_ORIENTATION=-